MRFGLDEVRMSEAGEWVSFCPGERQELRSGRREKAPENAVDPSLRASLHAGFLKVYTTLVEPGDCFCRISIALSSRTLDGSRFERDGPHTVRKFATFDNGFRPHSFETHE
jgi:hypothetical protein